MRTCVRMVVCVLIPRFELVVAAGGSGALARRPLALAPENGREQLVGQPSAAAEGCGVRAGMRLGEAPTRCPDLALVPPHPARLAAAWEDVLGALESIGAALASPRAGEAYFESGGLERLYGGVGHGAVEEVAAAARRALDRPARIGAGPSRFCAFVAALCARARRT